LRPPGSFVAKNPVADFRPEFDISTIIYFMR